MAAKFSRDDLNKLDKDLLVTLFLSLQDQMESMTTQLALLTEQIALMNQRTYGRKTEQIPGQINLADYCKEFENTFNEAEYRTDNSPEPEIKEVIISGYTRKKKTSREENLEGIPARIIEHKLSKEELEELFPHGYKELPEEIYKRLSIIPETLLVDEHHVHVYAAKDNDGTIIKANRPADLFRNSIATPSIVALTIHGKFSNHVPIERLARQFENNGVVLHSNTISNWVIRAADMYLSLVYDEMKKHILASSLVHADETPFRVTNDGREAGSQSYMWVYRTGKIDTERPTIIYDYQKTRASRHPLNFLKDFSGILVTDGYQVYHTVEGKRDNLTVAGCWIHAKRNFSELTKSNATKIIHKKVAEEAVRKIARIFHEDNKLDALSKAKREQERNLVVKPLVNDFFAWVKEIRPIVTAGSNTAKALNYCINQEKYLRVFLSDGNVPMDNNLAEQAIRPFTVGRKNWVNIASERGADASAILYSIVETAKANNLRVYPYLEMLLTELPKHQDETDRSFLKDLMPWSPKVQESCRILKKS